MNPFKVIFTVLIMFSTTYDAISQTYYIYRGDTINRTTENGLKYGHWIYFSNEYGDITAEQVDAQDPKICSEGYEKIISIPKDSIQRIHYDVQSTFTVFDETGFPVDDDTTGVGWLIHVNGELIGFSAFHNNMYSVDDGIWIMYDCNRGARNEIVGISTYSNGIRKTSYRFEDGMVVMTNVNTDFGYDKYKGFSPYVYERHISARDEYSYDQTIYYPDHKILFKGVQHRIFSTLLGTTDTLYFTAYSNSTGVNSIDSITSTSEYLYVINIEGRKINSLNITDKDSMQLGIVFYPKGNTAVSLEDTIYLHGKFHPEGKVEISISGVAYHLSIENLGVKKMTMRIQDFERFGLIINLCSFHRQYEEIRIVNEVGVLVKRFSPTFDPPCYGQLRAADVDLGTYTIELVPIDKSVGITKIKLIVI